MSGGVHVRAEITADTPMELIMGEGLASITFGDPEIATVDFLDVEALERVRDLANQGAMKLLLAQEVAVLRGDRPPPAGTA